MEYCVTTALGTIYLVAMAELSKAVRALEECHIVGENMKGEVEKLERKVRMTFSGDAAEKLEEEKVADAVITALCKSPTKRVKEWGLAQNRLASGLTWAQLKKRIADELEAGDMAEKMPRTTALFTMARQENEGVASFVLRFQSALQALCHPAPDPTKGNGADLLLGGLCDVLVRGLKYKALQAQVRRGMLEGRATTWRDTFTALVRSEAAILGVSDVGPVSADRGGGGDAPISATGAGARARRAAAEAGDQERRRRLGLCYHCGKKGHLKAECTATRASGNGGEAAAAP